MSLTEKRVVVVDDCTMTRTVLKNLLNGYGIKVSEASNETGLFNVLFEYGVVADLVIMDLTLGSDIGGYELICKMRDVKAYKDIPAIVLTSSSYKQDVMLGKLIGVADYIIKPYDEEDLIKRVKKVLKVE